MSSRGYFCPAGVATELRILIAACFALAAVEYVIATCIETEIKGHIEVVKFLLVYLIAAIQA